MIISIYHILLILKQFNINFKYFYENIIDFIGYYNFIEFTQYYSQTHKFDNLIIQILINGEFELLQFINNKYYNNNIFNNNINIKYIQKCNNDKICIINTNLTINNIFEYSAQGHNINIIKWIYSNLGRIKSNKLCNIAAKYGNLDIIDFLYNENYRLTKLTFYTACKYNKINIIYWLHNKKCPIDIDCIYISIHNNNDYVLNFLYQNYRYLFINNLNKILSFCKDMNYLNSKVISIFKNI